MAGCRGFVGPFPLPLSMSRHNATQASHDVHITSTIRDVGDHFAGRLTGMDWWRAKQAGNWVNGSTPLGLLVARVGRAQVTRHERGMLLATGYELGIPRAGAFTVGNVVVSRHDRTWLEHRPRLMAHEERHSWQYVACLGVPLVPLYLLAAGYSYLRGGDPAVHNLFERLAGLEDGGYPAVSRRTGGRPPRPA